MARLIACAVVLIVASCAQDPASVSQVGDAEPSTAPPKQTRESSTAIDDLPPALSRDPSKPRIETDRQVVEPQSAIEEQPPRWLGPSPLTQELFEQVGALRFRGPCLIRVDVSSLGRVQATTWMAPDDCAEEVKTALLDGLAHSSFEPATRNGNPVSGSSFLSIGHCPCYPQGREARASPQEPGH